MQTRQKRIANSEMIMHHVRTEVDGPKVVITANIHGDECTGFAVILSLLNELSTLLSKGEVFLYPTLNPTGLQNMTRVFPADGKDLNRLFPGNPLGSPAEKHVHTIWSSIRSCKPDLLLDLHTDSLSSIPYVILDRSITPKPQASVLAEMEELAEVSGLAFVWEYREKEYRSYQLEKSLSGACVNLLGIPALTLEVGPRRGVNVSSIQIMKEAILAILSKKGMLKIPTTTTFSGIPGKWFRSLGPISYSKGIFVPCVEAGQQVHRNEVIGRVYSVTGVELEVIRAHFPAMVLALPDRCWVQELQSCATLVMEMNPEP